MWEATHEIMEDFLSDDAIRVIVLTGAGGKAFVSGADISKFEDERANKEAVEKYGAAVTKAYNAVHHAAKPTIAMIRGYCIGGGVGLAVRSEEHTSELQSLMRISYAVSCLKKKKH